MKNAYLAICYACNEKCRYCPCAESDKKMNLCTPFNELIRSVDIIHKNGIDNITISGGEPTLHPQLISLLQYIQNHHMSFTLLTNSEKFASDDFMHEFSDKLRTEGVKIITTLHSESESEHELANQTTGSYQRTISGLRALIQNKFKIIIKHCITKENYKSLYQYYTHYNCLFPEQCDFQFCGIDYCGIPDDMLDSEMLSFIELKPYLEEMFEAHLKQQNAGNSRKLYCINIPLCSCDPYYWQFFSLHPGSGYYAYKDPHCSELTRIDSNALPCSSVCVKCKAYKICGGTYITAFTAFGDKIIRPYR